MTLLPRRRDDLDPARGVTFAALLILAAGVAVWLLLWGVCRLWGAL